MQDGDGAGTHGYDGPLKVSYGGTFTNLGKEFLDVAAAFDKERGLSDDPNGLYSCNKYCVSASQLTSTVSAECHLVDGVTVEMAKVRFQSKWQSLFSFNVLLLGGSMLRQESAQMHPITTFTTNLIIRTCKFLTDVK